MTSPRIYLEELSEEKHVDAIHKLWSNPENLFGSDYKAVTSFEDNRAWIRKRSRAAHPDVENFAILVAPSSPLYSITDEDGNSNNNDNSSSSGQQKSAAAAAAAPASASAASTAAASATPPSSQALSPSSSSAERQAKIIGFVGILRVAPPELGYAVTRPYWGRGVASEAVGLALARYWAAQPGVDAVEAYINEGHGASERVAARAGFVRDHGRTVLPGGSLPNGQVLDDDDDAPTVGIWVLKRPELRDDGGGL